MITLLLDLFFPKKCVSCGKPNSYFCRACISKLSQAELVCPQCERPAMGGQTHPICRRRYGLDGLWSLGIYQDPLRQIIKKFKYQYAETLAKDLVDTIVEYWFKHQPIVLDYIKKDYGQNWAVVPVPLHWFRQNKRGFNQSATVARLLARKLGLKYCEALKRIRYTKSQAKLKGRLRRINIKNAFAIHTGYRLNPIPNVLLIDDVWTTGSTLKECGYVLKKNGTKKVWVITLAR